MQNLGLFVNTLTVDNKQTFLKRDNLTRPIQIQLSNKQKSFYQFSDKFLKFRSNFEHLGEKNDPHRLCISDITECKRRGQASL